MDWIQIKVNKQKLIIEDKSSITAAVPFISISHINVCMSYCTVWLSKGELIIMQRGDPKYNSAYISVWKYLCQVEEVHCLPPYSPANLCSVLLSPPPPLPSSLYIFCKLNKGCICLIHLDNHSSASYLSGSWQKLYIHNGHPLYIQLIVHCNIIVGSDPIRNEQYTCVAGRFVISTCCVLLNLYFVVLPIISIYFS